MEMIGVGPRLYNYYQSIGRNIGGFLGQFEDELGAKTQEFSLIQDSSKSYFVHCLP
jgi:hypothetical protein